METATKPLGKITAVLADLGLEVTYAYDDLVFVQHCTFLLRFTNDPAVIEIFANVECTPKEADAVIENITIAAKTADFTMVPKGTFTLSQNEDDTLKIEFS